ncbi:BBP7 family outer membrane beta-barrel protein [Rhodopirellula sp. JC639]|uniref:BBP7 family outer membrane beta-barrel protein n=1 Tax=Stieleria mannarensis TaxID=2755585 RepID=UPI002570DF89|nr:BBP7 family outer membrane beta-barrel protein [Rhodopirellula sp. JC639]
MMSFYSRLRSPWTALTLSCMLVTSGVTVETTAAADGRAAPPRNVSAESEDSRRMTWRPVSPQQAVAKQTRRRNPSQQTVAPVSHETIVIEPPATDFVSAGGSTCGGHCVGASCDSIGGDGLCQKPRRRPLFSVHSEYLLWSLDAIDLPALVTTSPAGTSPENTGRLDQAGTSILFGGDGVGDEMRSGARVTLSWGVNDCGDGFELVGMGVFEDTETFRDSRALLARPVFDTGSGSESAMLVAHPDFLSGSLSVRVDSELFAFDVMRRQRLCTSACDQLDLLIGYRHGGLDESLRVDQSGTFTAAQGQIVAGTTQSLFDDFRAENRFNGAQIGLHYRRRCRSASTFNVMAKLGMGVNEADARIAGETINTVPGGGSSSFTGGLLAQSTNIGSYDESEFSVIPELGVMFTTRLDNYIDLSVGYNVLIWSNALRVGDLIDRNVSQFPPEVASGTLNPSFEFETDTFIAHGLTFGAVVSF